MVKKFAFCVLIAYIHIYNAQIPDHTSTFKSYIILQAIYAWIYA